MVIIYQASFPLESGVDMGNRFMEMPALPGYITERGPYLLSTVGEGVKTIHLYEFDESKYSEAHNVLADRAAKYIGVPGFTYSLTHWMEAKDALKLVGLG